MLLWQGQQSQNQFLCAVIVVALLLIAPGHLQNMEKSGDTDVLPKAEKSSVKKALDEKNIPLHASQDEASQDQNTINNKTMVQGAKAGVADATQPSNDEKITNNQAAPPPPSPKQPLDANNKTVSATKPQVANNNNKTPLVPQHAASTAAPALSEATIYQSDEEISDSLRTGFYFFVALSLSAITYIIFKVYRLRLSRAERKYGVQGDRSTQELTPLPIAIEDGHSDDEDQTLFEVQRQNIRIL